MIKVAIHALPRSGTKNLQINFQKYLLTYGADKVLAPLCSVGLGEPFIFPDSDFKTKRTCYRMKYADTGLYYEETKVYTHVVSEMISRFDFLINHPKKGWVYKRSIWQHHDPVAFETTTKTDKPIVVIRHDTFEHCVSFCLARHLNLWEQGQQMQQAITTHLENKIEISLADFEENYKWFNRNNEIKYPKEFQIVNFEDMVKIKDNTEFCNFFNIEYRNFDFSPFEIEYGNNKFNIINNLPELKKIADKLKNNE
jgi:hypothetical protein